MGADFLWSMTKYVEDPESAKAKVETLSDLDLKECAQLAFGDDDTNREDIIDYLKDAVDIAAEARYRRDVGSFYLPTGGTYVVTGGMSWGDNPTEAFMPIWVLDQVIDKLLPKDRDPDIQFTLGLQDPTKLLSNDEEE